jgi:hypothetical protein
MMKKDSNVHLLQDVRALNYQSYMDKYFMKDVCECIGEIGHSGSTIFSMIDLITRFWQMILHPKAHCFRGAWHGPISMGYQPNVPSGLPSQLQ